MTTASTPARPSLAARLALPLMLAGGIALLAFVATVPLGVTQQLLFSAVVFGIALVLRRREGRLIPLVLMGLSLVMSTRYMA